jgi:cellulose synthase/poly-beta-1,6-N-acetylglucosamine synthase-like glycosyltransferase
MIYQDNLLLITIFSIFALAALIQLFYYYFFYLSVYIFRTDIKDSEKKPVSIIICARNESENLKNFLPAVLEQKYPDFEVIVVNDCSEDETYDVLGKFIAQYPNLRVSNINKDPKFTHNKKFAQFIGIKAASNDILLFTDADCQPESDMWLDGMASNFDEKTSFVLGYGGYLNEKGILNKYIRYESMTIAMQYLGMAIRQLPYMGVGRNLAYRKSVFFNNNGFGAFNHIISGDDDLFVNTNASGKNTKTEFRKGTHTRSVPGGSFKIWFNQKKRHLSTAPFYKFRDKFFLLTEISSRIIFYITCIVLLSFTFMWQYVAAIFGIRLLTQIIIFSLIQKKLNEKGLVTMSLFFDIFSPIMNAFVFFSNLLDKPGKKRWK